MHLIIKLSPPTNLMYSVSEWLLFNANSVILHLIIIYNIKINGFVLAIHKGVWTCRNMTSWYINIIYNLITGTRCTELPPPFFSFCFTYLFSITFLYFFIISFIFPYLSLSMSIFIQSYVNSNSNVLTTGIHGTKLYSPLFLLSVYIFIFNKMSLFLYYFNSFSLF
jgi:hypothetical protein